MLSRVTIFLITIILIVAAFFGIIFDIITIDRKSTGVNPNVFRSPVIEPHNDHVTIDDQLRHTIWFLQVC